jgi:hypothetical protein
VVRKIVAKIWCSLIGKNEGGERCCFHFCQLTPKNAYFFCFCEFFLNFSIDKMKAYTYNMK